MSSNNGERRKLAVPRVEKAHFTRNFIRQAVCELRFPTLFDFDAERPYATFGQALRKEFPSHQPLHNINVNVGGTELSNAHTFRSKKGLWSASIHASAVSLETMHYNSFEEFNERLALVLQAASKVIDSDFFTRVGLRYINAVPCTFNDVSEWVNPALVGSLSSGVFGDVEECTQRIKGITDVGGFTLTHGPAINQRTEKQEYGLDFDFFAEEVELPMTLDLVQRLHELEYATFIWALGPRAREHLGPSTTAKGRRQ